jgi:single-stranded-DNA-specific exonuclease
MIPKLWVLRQLKENADIASLADSLNITEAIARVLALRGIATFSQAKKFFRPSMEDLHDPFLMSGMNHATQRVIEAVTENQKILVYGDYDVDGTASTALMYMFLKDLDADVEFYIPRRIEDGYGISEAGIDHAKQIGTKLLISVDCGITAVQEIGYASSIGIDVIVCDHHKPKEVLPNAFALLDPLVPGCQYPFKYLSGAGVAFKLAEGVSERIGKRGLPYKYLDLVALAGAADIVPLVDENRTLVREGLIMINQSPRPGVKALMQSAKLEPGTLTSGQIVFTLAPRINAVGRLGDARIAVELLTTTDPQEAIHLAEQLERDNFERKKIDEDTLNKALRYIDEHPEQKDDKVIILHDDNWHPGVIGIVASRIVEKYYKPTIMLTTIDGMAKGSARSIAHFNIYEALRQCEDLLVHFGGHEAAAGLAIKLENLEEFRRRLNNAVNITMDEKTASPTIEVDSMIKLSDITPKFIRVIEQFAPFGPSNMRPLFWASDVNVAGSARAVGMNGKHLQLTVRQNGGDKVFDAVAFDYGSFARELNNGHPKFDMIFSIEQKSREGKIYPQLRIRDMQLK